VADNTCSEPKFVNATASGRRYPHLIKCTAPTSGIARFRD
jgi:hypothetical protein